MYQDPVCKVWMMEGKERFSYVYLGEKFLFCSVSCILEFLKTPIKYWHSTTTLRNLEEDNLKDEPP